MLYLQNLRDSLLKEFILPPSGSIHKNKYESIHSLEHQYDRGALTSIKSIRANVIEARACAI